MLNADVSKYHQEWNFWTDWKAYNRDATEELPRGCSSSSKISNAIARPGWDVHQTFSITKGYEMITAEQLRASSCKVSCQLALDHATENGWLEDFNRVRRHPDTCVSTVLSIEEADRLWLDRKPSLLHDMGICVWQNSTEKVCFLTDDSQYGWQTLKERGWIAFSHKHRGTARGFFHSFKEFLDHYDKGYRVIESEEELVAYLNNI